MFNRDKSVGNTTQTLQRMYEETMARMQKIRGAGYNVPIWGASLENSCAKIQVLKMKLVRTSV
jgi:hypothetical protein